MVKPGDHFGKLTVLYINGKSKNRNNIWHCQCECGKTVDIPTASLTSGNTKSCGCLKKEIAQLNGVNKRRLNKYEFEDDYVVGYTFSNKKFYFDKEDYELVKQYTWSMSSDGYVYSLPFGKIVKMHMLVMKSDGSKDVDHINHKPFDNRKSNLRICDHYKNITYSKNYSNNISGQKGVYWDKSRNKWMTNITYNKKTYYLGRYNSFEQAAEARKQAEKRIHKEYHFEESKGDNII